MLFNNWAFNIEIVKRNRPYNIVFKVPTLLLDIIPFMTDQKEVNTSLQSIMLVR